MSFQLHLQLPWQRHKDSNSPDLQFEAVTDDSDVTSWRGAIVWVHIAGRCCRGFITDEREWGRTHHVFVQPLDGFKVGRWVAFNDIFAYEWQQVVQLKANATI